MARKKNQYFKLINNATPTAPRGNKPQEANGERKTDEPVGEKGRERQRERMKRKPRGNKEQHRVRKEGSKEMRERDNENDTKRGKEGKGDLEK